MARSSQIAEHGIRYDELHRFLTVEFRSATQKYRYREVPPEIFAKLCRAESVGSFIARVIKPHFACEKLAPGED